MLKIRKQRETESGNEAASVWARSGSPSAGVTTFATGGAGAWLEAATVKGALDNRGLIGLAASQASPGRQGLV
ncbi:MAG TPA: hypothetical protein VGO96_16595 [Pyrinomonadaceae bacterium]|jgi:hypothetical protein|nr:hypothetical protein [Pyrinomonadaceae bacterium]